ncbi:MAG: type II toxin-antitoxin system VapC family toxin [Chloroflexota bacterium]|nr:type II toxin-antitoxin system VapC family toxin [Chloroflexota bacterium]
MAERGKNFDCVVDASVGIKLFLVEPLSDRADALFDHLTDDPPSRFYVPDSFFIECTNVLWKYVRRFDYPADAARQDVADLTQLPLRVVSTAALADEALALAIQQGSTTCDSAYVALARQLSLPLVTADEALVRRFADIGLDVRFLGDWPG